MIDKTDVGNNNYSKDDVLELILIISDIKKQIPIRDLEQKADAVKELYKKFGAMGRTQKNLLEFEADYRDKANQLKAKG